MVIQLSPQAVQTLKSLDRIPDSLAETPRSIAEELLSFGLAYESRACGVINMTLGCEHLRRIGRHLAYPFAAQGDLKCP
jgi:hypothetical protein